MLSNSHPVCFMPPRHDEELMAANTVTGLSTDHKAVTGLLPSCPITGTHTLLKQGWAKPLGKPCEN